MLCIFFQLDFSLILFPPSCSVFRWDGVGEACAAAVTVVGGFQQASRSSPLGAVPFCPSFCAYPVLAVAPSLSFRMLCLLPCFFSPHWFCLTCPSPTVLLHLHTQDTRSHPGGAVCECVCECVRARMWLELFSYFSEFQGRKRRGILHHFSKDLWQDFGCGSPLPSPLICPMERSLLLSFTYIITSRNVEKER